MTKLLRSQKSSNIKRALGGLLLAGVVGSTIHVARAGVPVTKALVYAGTLMDGMGAPLTDEHAVEVGVFGAESGGAVLCPASQNSALTPDASGGFQIELDAACAAQIEQKSDLWLEVKVDGTPLARTKLGAVPYAIEARHAASADTASGPLDGRIKALEDALAKPSGFYALNTSGPTISNAIGTKVLFDTEEFDLNDEYDPATGIFKAKSDGYYQFSCHLIWKTSGTFVVETALIVNTGPLRDTGMGNVNTSNYTMDSNTVVALEKDDTVYCRAYQNSGAAAALWERRAAEAVSSFSGYRILR